MTLKGIVPDPDLNPTSETSYLEYPREVKMSEDLLFLVITTYKGTAILVKLPELPNPFNEEQQE